MIIGFRCIPFLPELAYLHCWSQKRRWKQFSSGNDLSTSSLQTAMKSFISLLSESWSCTPLVSISCSHFCRSLDSSLLRDFISTLCWSSLVRRFSQVIILCGVPVCTKFLDGLSLRLLSRSLLFWRVRRTSWHGLHLLPITSIAQSFARIHEWYETFPFDAQKSPSRKATMSVEFAVVISVSTDARVWRSSSGFPKQTENVLSRLMSSSTDFAEGNERGIPSQHGWFLLISCRWTKILAESSELMHTQNLTLVFRV